MIEPIGKPQPLGDVDIARNGLPAAEFQSIVIVIDGNDALKRVAQDSEDRVALQLFKHVGPDMG